MSTEMNKIYEITCPLTEYWQITQVKLQSKDGWNFINSEKGSHYFRNHSTLEEHFYPVSQTLLRIYMEKTNDKPNL